METRGLVDWVEEGFEDDRAPRPVDDWTAGDDLDFTVARRRRITGESAVPQVDEPAERRTVTISARPGGVREVPRLREVQRRRPSRGPVERVAARPDRIAMWAVALGFVLIFIAAASSH